MVIVQLVRTFAPILTFILAGIFAINSSIKKAIAALLAAIAFNRKWMAFSRPSN